MKFYNTLITNKKLKIIKEIIDRLRYLVGKIELIIMQIHISLCSPSVKYNSDLKFYIISGTHLKMRGLFGDVNAIFFHCVYAFEQGYIPVIDFKHVKNNMISDRDVNKVNGWETLFLQPTEYDLNSALASKHKVIIDCHGNGSLRFNGSTNINWQDPDNIKYWHDYFIKAIKIKPSIMSEIEQSFKQTFNNNDRILGVKIRGTDYTLNKPYGHPIQPNPSDVIEHAYRIIQLYNCNKLFLSCEDATISDMFKAKFGQMLVTGNVKYQLSEDEYLYDYYAKNRIDKFDNNLEYLTNTIFLSKCNCLITSQNSTTMSLRLWRSLNNYEYLYIYDLGLYGK